MNKLNIWSPAKVNSQYEHILLLCSTESYLDVMDALLIVDVDPAKLRLRRNDRESNVDLSDDSTTPDVSVRLAVRQHTVF